MNLGFKILTPENWLEPDDASTSFVRLSASNGKYRPITGEQYLNDIMKPGLIEAVPKEICALFEVARGAMAYGYFFYPLYTLACEQLFRVADAATIHKCKAVKASRSIITGKFEERLIYLISGKFIPLNKEDAWYATRKLRNKFSHPERQSILLPGQAIGMLEHIADEINSLFSNT
ncbi:hypothetical protein ES705_01676 [subsurface metagenome]|nr:hypothetical protein [Clostridia bacterium]